MIDEAAPSFLSGEPDECRGSAGSMSAWKLKSRPLSIMDQAAMFSWEAGVGINLENSTRAAEPDRRRHLEEGTAHRENHGQHSQAY